jgi:hypothetical protein
MPLAADWKSERHNYVIIILALFSLAGTSNQTFFFGTNFPLAFVDVLA